MKWNWSRKALVALLTMALGTGLAQAGGQPPPMVAYPNQDQPNALPPNSVKKPLLYRMFHPIEFQHPVGCPTHHDDFGCGSPQAEWVFFWGSCRDFWSEPCNKGRVPYPPKGAQPPPGGVNPEDIPNNGRGCPFCK